MKTAIDICVSMHMALHGSEAHGGHNGLFTIRSIRFFANCQPPSINSIDCYTHIYMLIYKYTHIYICIYVCVCPQVHAFDSIDSIT